MTVSLAHLLLECRDLEAAKRFYLNVLGFTVRTASKLSDGRDFVSTHQGLGLTTAQGTTGRQIDHIAFRVGDVDELAQRCALADTPIAVPLGPGIFGRTIYVIDPDGTKIELFQPGT